MKPKKSKTITSKSEQEQDAERQSLLKGTKEKKGLQLRVDIQKGDIKEVNEIKELLNKRGENPDEKYNLYYKGITKLLRTYLPKGRDFKQSRDLIYDEKNIFLNRGKRKSDNDGIRGSDGRMTFQPVMGEMLDVIAGWVSETQDPIDLYDRLYALNDKHGYGHEQYDETSKEFQKSKSKEKGK